MTPIAPLRERLSQARKSVEEGFLEEGDARSALDRLTGHIDEIVRRAGDEFLAGQPAAALAIGGYGRRELFPGSDVDLLFVHMDDGQEEPIKRFLHHLWDLGLQVGHQVWRLGDLEAVDLRYSEFVLALLDARAVAGDEVLSRRVLRDLLPRLFQQRGSELAERLVQLTRQRHEAFRDTVYQLEPDLKQSPGGLRDYWTGVWLKRLRGREAFLAVSQEELARAHEFLCRLRLNLHLIAGRKQDRLTHKLQETVAERIGYGGSDPKSAVESLMNKYFLSAHTVVNFCRRNMRAVDPAREEAEPIECTGAEVSGAADVLRLFLRSLEEGRPLADSARDASVRILERIPSTLRGGEATGLLRRLFQPRPRLYRTLSEMYELGVLEMIFPEFSGIKERVVRDFYHHYTVDEHTLLAIKHIEELGEQAGEPDRRFADLLGDTRQPELLTLSLLLHDVGKGRDGRHAQRSATMASKALRRLGFATEEVERVSELIREHLTMSSVAFRRDLDDAKAVNAFADRFKDVEQLRQLTLLTYADIRAVGPGILTDWKKDLLFQLYVAAYNRLTRGYGAERISKASIGKRLLEQLPEDVDKGEFLEFLRGFPKRYLRSGGAREIAEHFRMARRLEQDPVQIRVSRSRDHWQLCVITPDRERLFSRIAGALTYYDMNILRGSGFSNRQGVILDLFHFSDTRSTFSKNPQEIEGFRRLLRSAIRDEVSIAKLLRQKEKSPLYEELAQPVQANAYFPESHSRDYSILEVVAPDSLGLLHRIGRQIAALGCDIELLLISTEGSRAVDVFYVSRDGQALQAETRGELASRIVGAIEEPS